MIKQNKKVVDKERQKPKQKFKQKQDKFQSSLLSLFQTHLQTQPPLHIKQILSNNTAIIQTHKFTTADLPQIKLLLTLKLSSITLKCSNKLIDRQIISQTIKKVKLTESKLHHLSIHNFHLLNQFGKEIEICLSRCKSLKEIEIVNCSINDELLRRIMYSFQTNSNIRLINLSNNKIMTCGSIIEMLKQQQIYLNDKMEMKEINLEEVYDKQILDLNLEGNLIDDREAYRLAEYLKVDKLIKCLNLSHNKITKNGVGYFSQALDQNKMILNLDLRSNLGSNIEMSNLIFNKLLKNMVEYKTKKPKAVKKENNSIDEKMKKDKSKQKSNTQTQNQTFSNHKNPSPPKRFQKNNFSKIEQKQEYQYSFTNPNNHQHCPNCKKLNSKVLKTQKRVLDYQLQNAKLKKILQNRGFEISMIKPQSHPNQSISFNAKNPDSSSDDLVQKIEYMMLELTKILEAHELMQNTQVDITNPAWTNNNLSNTVQILAHNQYSIVVPLLQEEDQELSDIRS